MRTSPTDLSGQVMSMHGLGSLEILTKLSRVMRHKSLLPLRSRLRNYLLTQNYDSIQSDARTTYYKEKYGKKTPSKLGTSRPAFSSTLISFLSTNARSLFNKMDELQHITYRTNPLFICITESWCSHEEPDSLYSIDGYSLFRKDRLFRAGGGILIHVQDSQIDKATQLADLDVHVSNEELWIRIIPQFRSPLVVCCTYRL